MRGGWLLRVVTVALFVLILHVGIAPNMRISGVAAELPVGLAVAAGLTGGVERGAFFGFFFGLIVDMFLFTPIGLSAGMPVDKSISENGAPRVPARKR